MRAVLSLPLLVLAALALPPASGAASFDAAVYADATGAYLADFSYDGPCNGQGTVTLVIHRPSGDDVRTAAVTSTAPVDTCGVSLSCLDCPPIPDAYVWTLKGAGVLLVGGGPSAYYQYQDAPLAYSLSGVFQGGTLEAAGAL
jgi:hypothetical protein